MSFRLVDRVLDLEGMHPTDKLVLVQLAKKANDDGTSCFPGEQWLARKVGISERKVRDALRHLKLHGYLRITRRQRQSNSYTLTIDQGMLCSIVRSKCLDRTPGSYYSVSTHTSLERRGVAVSTAKRRRLRRPNSSPSKDFDSVRKETGPVGPIKAGGYKFQHCEEDEDLHGYSKRCKECVDREGMH